jgi:hypothetical protein
MKSYKGACLAVCAGWLGLGLSTSASAADERSPVRDILFAQAFRLDKPYAHTWQKEQPSVSAGYLLVLAVDPEFVRPQQVAEPVLYVGNQTAERINAGDVSGRLVVLVPSSVNAQGEIALDLQAAPIWFGAPELPERIDAAQVSAELDAALRKGAKPFPDQKVGAALRRGGKALRLPNREALEQRVARLLQEYSPNERDLIRGLAANKQ